ncbi:GH116 family glycosyl-hydrolase [Diplocloster hominis]|uniref:GH116 family glycosyl-hydrolase n=1 Tax=Diplocloster hominis TaxID=3079010 RepID=UPI0031BA522F
MRAEDRIYPLTEIYSDNTQKTYDREAKACDFLLGGIGTGNISVGARGELRSWQIFNQPALENSNPYTFFAIRTQETDGRITAKVLESEYTPPFAKAQGFLRSEVAGWPRCTGSVLSSKYPFVEVKFRDKDLPVEVSMEAFTPFIPLNADDSGIPGAYIRYQVSNPTSRPVTVSVAGSLNNAVGFEDYDMFDIMTFRGQRLNEKRTEDSMCGIYESGEQVPENMLSNGTMVLATSDMDATIRPYWLQGQWTDGAEDFWDDFTSDGEMEESSETDALGCRMAELFDFTYLHFLSRVGTVCSKRVVEPGTTETFEFVITWHFPNRVKGWPDTMEALDAVGSGEYETIRNYYAVRFADAWDAARYLLREKNRLEAQSRMFSEAFYQTTLPGYVLEAVANNITVLRSPTCFRIENGDFLGWEGVDRTAGCGSGTCTHVWNYAQTAAYLFPELERSMRRIEFLKETRADGHMAYRTFRGLGLKQWDMLPSADGQLGAVVRIYREWKLSGDDEFLRECWEPILRCMEFARRTWDQDGDGLFEQAQHVTYDTELYGITSMVSTIYLAALKAAAEMAEYLGEIKKAGEFREIFEKGSKKLDEISFNGEYYIQILENPERYRYQYGEGCLADQLLGQYMAHCAGLGYVLDTAHVKTAVESIFRYDFIRQARDYVHGERAFILNEESGLTPCTWPKGGKPRFPFTYYGEVWTGIEYEVAALLLFEGLTEEGLTVVKAVRERHDGYKRNPWSEVESGNYYTRSMASYGVYLALTGFSFDHGSHTLSFKPQVNEEDFSGFWCNGRAWGTYRQKRNPASGELEKSMEVLYGDDTGLRLV